MMCCGERTRVVDSRPTKTSIRRRRQCDICNARYTTIEVLSEDYARVPNPKLVMKLLKWLTSGHSVSTLTKDRADYWAHQFKFVIKKAKQITGEN